MRWCASDGRWVGASERTLASGAGLEGDEIGGQAGGLLRGLNTLAMRYGDSHSQYTAAEPGRRGGRRKEGSSRREYERARERQSSEREQRVCVRARVSVRATLESDSSQTEPKLSPSARYCSPHADKRALALTRVAALSLQPASCSARKLEAHKLNLGTKFALEKLIKL